jgi:hypothetical protein
MNNSKEYMELPELVELAQFGGDFHKYLEAVYEIFKQCFIDQRPVYRGIRLGLKKISKVPGQGSHILAHDIGRRG